MMRERVPTDHDLLLYRQELTRNKKRIDRASDLLESDTPTEDAAEIAALNIRFALEHVVLGTLAPNRIALEDAQRSLAVNKAGEARKKVRSVNPNYWPEPQKRVAAGPGKWIWEDITDDYLKEDDWATEWGFVSSLLHARGPYRDEADVAAAWTRMRSIVTRLMRLTEHHVVHLADRDVVLAGQIGPDAVHVTYFERVQSVKTGARPNPATVAARRRKNRAAKSARQQRRR